MDHIHPMLLSMIPKGPSNCEMSNEPTNESLPDLTNLTVGNNWSNSNEGENVNVNSSEDEN